MGKVTALMMDTITEKSGHSMTGMAVSVCLTPAAPAPLPIPYPTMGSVSEGIIDPCMRTKIEGEKILTVGGCMKACHGNEAGTLKEVVSLNTGGPCFPWLGAPIVFIELGMAGITGSMGQMNKAITVGAGATASGAGGGGGGGGGGGAGAGGPGGPGNQSPSNSGGGGGGSNSGAAPPSPPGPPGADGQANAGHPIDVATGTLFTSPAVDFQLTGPMWVSFVRSYRTSSVEHDIGLGRGWSHSLAWRAVRRGDRLLLVDETLRETELTVPAADEVVVLPFGRKLWIEGGLVLVDTGDGLVRILRETDHPGHFILTELRDASGHSAELEWENGELAAIVDAVGRRAWVEKEGPYRSWWVTANDAQGIEHRQRLVTFEIDDRRDLVRAIDAGGAETRFVYDDDHYLVREERPDRVRFHFVHAVVEGQRRCVETWGDLENEDILSLLGAPEAAAQGRPRGIFHTRVEYGPGPTDRTVVDSFGARHTYIGNAFGLVERYIDPRGYTSTYRYDAAGRLASITDGGGLAVRSQPGADGAPRGVSVGSSRGYSTRIDAETSAVIITGPDGSEERIRSEHGKPVEIVDPEGRRTLIAYDEHGLKSAITHPNGTVQSIAYDAHGNVAEVKGPTGATYRYVFDLFGKPTRIESAGGMVYELAYDSRGDLVRLAESTGRVTDTVIDDARRVVEVRESTGPVTRFRYVASALVEKIEPDGSRWRFGHDASLRLVWIENPAGERFARGYDAAGNIVRERSFSGQAREAQYDGSNLPVLITRSGGASVRLERDGLGRIVKREHSTGRVEHYGYDAGGRLVLAENPEAFVAYTYDERGRLAAETQSTQGWKFTTHYTLDDCGLVVGKTFSTGWDVALERRPEDGTPIAMTLSGEAPATLRFERDAMGDELSRRAGDLALSTRRDALGRPTEVRLATEEGDDLRLRTFDWSPLGPLAAIADDRAGPRRYELDARGRVTRTDGLGATERFAYAPQGTAVPVGAAPWHLVAGGRPTTAGDAHLEWDGRGRLSVCSHPEPRRSFRYVYDDDDKLVSAVRGDDVRFRYLYDALGRRIAEVGSTGESTWFGWDGDAIVEEQTIGKPAIRRVFDDDGHTPLAETSPRGAWRMVACDAAATPWLYAGEAGELSDIDLTTWGHVARKNGDPGPLRFAGQHADASTGLHYNRHRYYDPSLHVFLTPDPLGIHASLQDVGFVPNVTLYIDPLGLTTIVAGSRTDSTIQGSVRRLQAEYPGARVIYSDQLGQPPSLWQRIRGQNNRLDSENHVVVTTHGAPGSVDWGRGSANGQQIGNQLNGAGFNGHAPGAHVDLIACNGATPPSGGRLSDSVAGGIARTTGADTSGAMSGQPERTYRHETDALNGVRDVRDWPRFWRYRQEPATHQYGPGMMSGTPNSPYVHNGSYVTYGQGVW